MKTLEHDPRLPAWLNALLNAWPFAIDANRIRSAAFAIDELGAYRPGTRSLFYNGFVMVRACWPAGLWLHLKPARSWRFQCGTGYKLNGRLGLTLRVQSDASAAAGVLGPNVGQALGWQRGTA